MIDDAWNAIDVAAIDTHAFVAAAWSGLRVVDVSDRDAAVEVAALSEIGDVTAVKAISDVHILASVAAGSHQGVVTIDVSDPLSPTIAGRLPLPDHAEVVDAAVEGNVAVVVAYDGFVHVIDIADVAMPRLVATVDASPLPDSPLPPRNPARPEVIAGAIDMEGGMAFVGITADRGQRAWIVSIDASVPLAPRQRHALSLPTDLFLGTPPVMAIRDVGVDDGRLALGLSAAASAVLYRVDDEGALSEIHRLWRPGLEAMAVAWQGDMLVLSGLLGHDAFDARDLARARNVASRGSFPLIHHLNRRHGGLAFLADGTILQAHGTQGLLIADPIVLPVTPTATASPTATATPTSSQPEPWLTPAPTIEASPTAEPTDVPPPTPSGTPPPTTEAPSPTPPPTQSPIPPSPPPSPSPSPTPTRRATGPSTVYLPLALAETCPPKDYFVDVVLVVDASTSMRERVPDGRRKLDVVLDAVRTFAAGMRLTPGQDRAAVVSFNAGATLVQGLTHDRASLEAALERVQIAQYSRLDLGIERAAAELLVRGRAGRGQAMVVLSDGLVNPVSGAVAIEAARRARQQRTTIWVVGLGPSLDERTLLGVASGADRYQRAAGILAVEAIYQDLTRRVPCPVEIYWGRR